MRDTMVSGRIRDQKCRRLLNRRKMIQHHGGLKTTRIARTSFSHAILWPHSGDGETRLRSVQLVNPSRTRLKMQRWRGEGRVGNGSDSCRMTIESRRRLLDWRRLLLDISSAGTMDDLEIIRSINVRKGRKTG